MGWVLHTCTYVGNLPIDRGGGHRIDQRGYGIDAPGLFVLTQLCESIANILRICCVFDVERTQTSDGVAETTIRRRRCA